MGEPGRSGARKAGAVSLHGREADRGVQADMGVRCLLGSATRARLRGTRARYAAERHRPHARAGTKRGKQDLVSLQPAPSDALEGLDDAKEIVSKSLGRASQLSLPEAERLEEAA